MGLMIRLAHALLAVSLVAGSAHGQSPGEPSASLLRATVVPDTSLTYLLAHVRVLADTFVAAKQLRVLAAHGASAGDDSDARLTRVYISLNEDGTDYALFRFVDLYEARVDSVRGKDQTAVVFLSYGRPASRTSVRADATLQGVVVRPTTP